MIVRFMLPELTGSLEQLVRFIGRVAFQAMHDPCQRPLAIRRLVREKILTRSRKQPWLRAVDCRRILPHAKQHMHMVRHDAVRQQVVLAASMMIEVASNQRRNSRIGEPIDFAGLVQILVVGRKELLVKLIPHLGRGGPRGLFFLPTFVPTVTKLVENGSRNGPGQAIRHEMPGRRDKPVRQIPPRDRFAQNHGWCLRRSSGPKLASWQLAATEIVATSCQLVCCIRADKLAACRYDGSRPKVSAGRRRWILTVPSSEAESSREPSWLQAHAFKGHWCASMVRRHRPSAASHTLTVLSSEPEASRIPSGLQAHDITALAICLNRRHNATVRTHYISLPRIFPLSSAPGGWRKEHSQR